MMRLQRSLAAIALLLFSAFSLAEARFTPENHLRIGAGFYAESGVFEGMDYQVQPWPLIDAYYEGWFIKDNQAGFEMVRDGNVALFFAAQYNPTELDASEGDENMFLGIEDRDTATELGIIGHYHSPVGLIEGHYFKGVSGTHEAYVGKIKISRNISETGDLLVQPGLAVRLWTDEYNRYYFSVSEEENIRGQALTNPVITIAQFEEFRPQYSPGNSGHVEVDLLVEYAMTENLILSTYVAVEDITGQWEESPLVEEKSLMKIRAGLIYKF